MSYNKIISETSGKERVAYGFSEMATNFTAQFVAFFQLFFLIDIIGLPTTAISILMFAFRVFDALDDQIIGFLICKSANKRGSYKKNFITYSVPFALISGLMFFSPNFSLTNKIIYTAVVYLIWEVLSTILQVTTGAIMPFMSKNEDERTKIVSIKTLFAISSILVISLLKDPLVNFFGSSAFFGAGGEKTGYFLTGFTFAMISIPMYIFAYRNINERYFTPKHSGFKIMTAIKYVFNEKGLLTLIFMYMFFCIACAFKNSMAVFYLKYVLKNEALTTTFIFTGISASLLMQFVIPYITRKIKKEICVVLGLSLTIISVLLLQLTKNYQSIFLLVNILFGIFSSLPANLIFTLTSRYVDKAFDKGGVDLSTQVYAALSFVSKVGTGVAGGVCPLVMQWTGYVPSETQSLSGNFGISMLFIVGTGLSMLISAIFAFVYFTRTRQKSIEMESCKIL